MAYCTTDWYVSNRLGVGTDAPETPINIRCDSSSQAAVLRILTCAANSGRRVDINAGAGIEYTIPDGTSQSPYFQVEGGSAAAGGGSFRIRTGIQGGVADRLAVTQGGRVGIGTLSPSETFHVNGTSQFDDGLNMTRGKISWGGSPSRFIVTSCGGYNMVLGTDNFTDRMTIQNTTGNVGIGTSTPNSRLHVITSGTSNYTEGANRGMILTSDAGARLILENPAATVCNNHRVWTMKNDFGRLSFGLLTDSGAAWVNENILTMVCAGNVGIGQTSPSFKLHVCSNVQSDGLLVENQCRNIACFKSATEHSFIYIDSNHACVFQPAIFFMRSGNLFSELRLQRASSSDPLGAYTESEGLIGSTGNTPFSIQSCGTRRLFLGANGNVGINCITPSYRLHVNGSFYAAGSSCEYKTSVCQYDTDSCMFMKLKPVTYQYKDEYKHLGKELKSETQIGLIAEEVAETYPELAILVNEEDNKVVRNVDYEKLSIVLLSEVQKLRKEVDDLKTK
jgi:hypothetical protein